jgi:hypothetical protein
MGFQFHHQYIKQEALIKSQNAKLINSLFQINKNKNKKSNQHIFRGKKGQHNSH